MEPTKWIATSGMLQQVGHDETILREIPYQFHPAQEIGNQYAVTPNRPKPTAWEARFSPNQADQIA